MKKASLNRALLVLPMIMVSACGPQNSKDFSHPSDDHNLAQQSDASLNLGHTVWLAAEGDVCIRPDFAPEKFAIGPDEPGTPFIDESRDIKDLGTNIVIKNFFTTPDTLFSFMKLVYGNLDQALAKFRAENGLEERAIFVLFKGGNVLRMMANGVFNMLPFDAKRLLKKNYAEFFKRSDADFSVYVDEQKLGKLDYDKTFADITTLIYDELNKIRDEFKANPEKYFNLMQVKSDYAAKELAKFFAELNKLPAIEDIKNTSWYGAKFSQLQLLDDRAESGPDCPFFGQYDYRYDLKDGQIDAVRISKKPDWIANTDNRTLQWTWGSDESKVVKFSLVRSKAIFEYSFEKDGEKQRKPMGGELIDVSLPNRADDRLREFLDNYDTTVADYTITAEGLGDPLKLKSYSLSNLAEDLQFIIFDSFDRPWNGGPKYGKRVNRLFFLHIIEMLGSKQMGLGSSRIKHYVQDIRKNILTPLASFYPLNENSAKVAEMVSENVKEIADCWKDLPLANHFWRALSKFVSERLLEKPLKGDAEKNIADDQKSFTDMLEIIGKNIDTIDQLKDMTPMKINMDDIYNVELNDLH